MGKPATAVRSAQLRAWLMGGAALSLLAATQAMAQDAPPAEAPADEEELVITGIRETLRTSIDVKKRETAIVDNPPQPFELVGRRRDELLSAETGSHRHQKNEICVRQSLFKQNERGCGIYRYSSLSARLSYRDERSV